MPRTPRESSSTGIHHVILRGINRGPIFMDERDRNTFLDALREYKEECGFELYAYCLMPNHVHLLLREGERASLEDIFKRLGTKYALWFNKRHERVGHLFQDRFRSEPVTDDRYFMTVLRYIHLNPVEAGMSTSPEDYPYSSFRSYLGRNQMVDTDFPLSLFDGDVGRFVRFHGEKNDARCLELRERLTDEQAGRLLFASCGCDDLDGFHDSSWKKQRLGIRALLSAGVEVARIARLSGVSYWRVRREKEMMVAEQS